MLLGFGIIIASVFVVDGLILPSDRGQYHGYSWQPKGYEDQFHNYHIGNLFQHNSYKSNEVINEYYEEHFVDDQQARKNGKNIQEEIIHYNPYKENNDKNVYEVKKLYNTNKENNGFKDKKNNSYKPNDIIEEYYQEHFIDDLEAKKPINSFTENYGKNTYEEKKQYSPYNEKNGVNNFKEKRQYNSYEENIGKTTYVEKKPYNPYKENGEDNSELYMENYGKYTLEELKPYNPYKENNVKNTFEEIRPYNPYKENKGENDFEEKEIYNTYTENDGKITYEELKPYNPYKENIGKNTDEEIKTYTENDGQITYEELSAYNLNNDKGIGKSYKKDERAETPYNTYKQSNGDDYTSKDSYYPDEKNNELFDFIPYEESYPQKEEVKVYSQYKNDNGNNAYLPYEETNEHSLYVLHEVNDDNKIYDVSNKNDFIVSINDSDHSVHNYDSNEIYQRPILYSEDLSNYQSFLSECFERKFATSKVEPNQRTMRIYSDKDRIESSEVSLLSDDNDQVFDYETLRSTPHGRHLLMITLLEKYEKNYWEKRCEGLVQMYLPDSLKSPTQPSPPKNACHMKEIIVDGYTWDRQDVEYVFNSIVASKIFKNQIFSRYDMEHSKSLQSLVKFALWMPDFDSMMSLLVVIRDSCNKRLFMEGLASIIQAREDVGFIVPSLMSIIPEYFIPLDETLGGMEDRGELRQSRQGGRQRQQGGQVIRFGSTHSTYPANEPERHMWHIREDPVYSSMHWIWHLILSDGNISSLMRRRGEMFFFMHRQMLNRYNADRLAVGLAPVVPYTPRDWQRPGALIGYTPRLLRGYSGRGYNQVMPANDARQLGRARTNLLNAVRRRVVGTTRLGYANGVDFGISDLGDATEPVGANGGIGNYHNGGHITIAGMSMRENGVMGGTENAIKDPAFYRWHENIDEVFSTYKRDLGRYSDNDLNFDSVTVTSINTVSQGVTNRLRTFLNVDSLQISYGENLLTNRGGRRVNIERIAYDPFVYNIQLQSTMEGLGVGRIFLVPSTFANRDSYEFAIEMDKFLIRLNPGLNTIQRSVNESPVFSSAAPSLNNLQSNLLRGMSERDFNWANCGYPVDMALPRGTTNGMSFQLVFIVSPLLQQDRARVNDWSRTEIAWGWCGFRERQRGLPDSRPLGFPFDRHLSVPDITNGRSNAISTPITIVHSG